MTAMQSIRLLETQTPPPHRATHSPQGSSSPAVSTPASGSASKRSEPWRDIQFSVDGVASSSPGGIINLSSSAASDTAAIAPWMTDDSLQETPPIAVPQRRFFPSSKVSLTKASSPSTNSLLPQPSGSSRNRNNSEASTSYALAANGVNGTPFQLGSEFGAAWGLPASNSSSFLLSRAGSVDPYGTASMVSVDTKDSKKTLRDRGKDFGRLLKKKASKISLGKQEGSDEGHSVLPIPPLPYPSASSTNLGAYGFPSTTSLNPPLSPTTPKEAKKRKGLVKIKYKDKDKDGHYANGYGTNSAEFPVGGDPEITLDTNLDNMNGIIRPQHEQLSKNNYYSSTSNVAGSFHTGANDWDADHPSSLSEHGSLGPPFTDPWAPGPSTAGSGTITGFNLDGKRPLFSHSRTHSGAGTLSSTGSKRKSNPPAPLVLTGPSPKGSRGGHHPPSTFPPPAQQPVLPSTDESKDPQWHAPESWDVDKVGPEAQDYSSGDEDAGGTGGRGAIVSSTAGPNGPTSREEADELRDFGIIDMSPAIGVSSQQGGGGLKRLKSAPANPFNSIGMIGGVGGGAYGIGMAGYGRLKTKPESASGAIGPFGGFGSGSIGGQGSFSGITTRKDSWPDNDDVISRRPSDALSSSTAPKTPLPSFHLRVYRIDGTYHIVECPVTTTAHDLSHVLRKKLLLPGQHFKLHLRERGRERVLGQQERPINILRRRLEQAGYDDTDDLEHLGGDDLGFLLRFVFRDANVPAASSAGDDDISTSSSMEHIDLTGRGLLTIPIALHRHAPTIVVLNLSKNPHIDIPLDFIASCGMLRDLRLSHAAMKQVPSRVKHISTLHELDISCNRMVTLDEADLHQIPGLRNVQVQNNRLATLPSSFSEMKSLKYLNISNNKFDSIPAVLSQITSLYELDLSFNTVSTFPPELGKLVNLERLVIVGNRIGNVPPEVANMIHLKELDCRRNAITDLSAVFLCPLLEVCKADNNLLHELRLPAKSKIRRLYVSGNERLSSFTVEPVEPGYPPYALEVLNLSKCMVSKLEDSTFVHLINLISFKFDHNTIRSIPDTVCQLPELEHLSGSNNHLSSLPEAIGQLNRLRSLHIHNNNIKLIPSSIWQCPSLVELSASSNLITNWGDPVIDDVVVEEKERRPPTGNTKAPASSHGKHSPPLATCLERLYLADNRLDDDVFHALSHLQVLQILNLSWNDIYELPPLRLPTFAQVRELYLSGNKLTSLPGEDLHRLPHLRVLFLNANKLQTLPSELTKVKTLECLDVGNNVLKYNIANWQFDWNWNFNRELRYLNLSGNKRLEIKNPVTHDSTRAGRAPLTDFSELTHLRSLGLMDVTLSTIPIVPDESDERRVRTSPSDINGMAYGIADTLGVVDSIDKPNNLKLSMFDLVVPYFRGRGNKECLFGMFGRHVPIQNGNRPNSNRLTRFLQQEFTHVFTEALRGLRVDHGETVPDALRRAFLALNKGYFESLKPPEVGSATNRKMSNTTVAQPQSAASINLDSRSAASGLVLYIVDEPDARMMYVANVGSILAVVSRKQTNPMQVSTNHDPFDRSETARIRAAEGWVSPKGTVNDELEISRSFGVFHLLPAVNARPEVAKVPLTDQDEFVIIGNRGLWDYVSPQTAVDIARQNKNDPMIAAQRLRDYAMSYGAQGSTMIMVIAVGDLFHPRARQPAMDTLDMDLKRMAPRRTELAVGDRTLARLGKEIPPPVQHLALVFTDIRNSTRLWEKNPGMPTAMKLHNSLLRRQLREIGGYEVKTEGDSFMVSFQSVTAALLWCFNVQIQLLQEEWPPWILDSEDGQEIHDTDGQVLARGLSVRMGIHCGSPNCEPDPVTGRMDYFGTMVNRSARIMGSAKGGQIMVSSDVVKELTAAMPMEDVKPGLLASVDNAPLAPESSLTIETIQRMGLIIRETGEHRLKGLEVPEMLAQVYPKELAGRLKLELEESPESAVAKTRAQFSVEQVRSLALLTIRIEALASERVFRPASTLNRSYSVQSANGTATTPDDANHPIFMHANPELLTPAIGEHATDADLLQIMDSLSVRINNAVASLYLKHVGGYHTVLSALEKATSVDQSMLVQALSLFSSLLEA